MRYAWIDFSNIVETTFNHGSYRVNTHLLILCFQFTSSSKPTLCSSVFTQCKFFTLGKVIVDGKVVTKAGHPVSDKSVVEIKAEIPKYVCR